MVRDIELPFSNHTKMTRCQLKFLLYLLTKQDGDIKTKWWPDNIRFELPITNRFDISKDTLIDLFKSYYKFNGDSEWLRAVIDYIENLDNLTNETDFTSIDISGKISHRGVYFDIVPSLKNIQQVQHVTKKKKFSILNQSKDSTFNISPAVIKHLNSNGLEDKTSNFKTKMNMKNVKTDDQDVKLCIKESHIRRMMPIASVQLYDVVKYDKKYSKEDFLLTLNLMKTDVLSKLNLLTFRKRLRNTSRDTIKSASEFEKDLIKFRSKPSKEVFKNQKQKENNKKPRMKIKEKDKIETNTNISECMIIDHADEKIDDHDNDTNKENRNKKSSNKTPVNILSSPKIFPFQSKNTICENTDSIIIDLTLEDTPTKVPKSANNLYQFLNISPLTTPKSEKSDKLKQSPPRNLKRLNRHSMPLLNQKDIKSYFNPIPMKLSPEFLAKKLEELQKLCRPCFVRLDLVKDLKPIRSIIEKSADETKFGLALPLPLVIEESAFIDLTNDEDMLETANENEITATKECDIKDKVKHKPKKDNIKKKKTAIKIKWPTKRLTL